MIYNKYAHGGPSQEPHTYYNQPQDKLRLKGLSRITLALALRDFLVVCGGGKGWVYETIGDSGCVPRLSLPMLRRARLWMGSINTCLLYTSDAADE